MRLLKKRHRLAIRLMKQVITYGIHHDADIMAKDVAFFTRKDGDGTFMPNEDFSKLSATIVCGSERAEITLTNCISETMLSSALAALAVARFYGVLIPDAIHALEKQTKPVHGRLNPIPGIRGSLIIDDSYNAAPASVLAALNVLSTFTPGETHDRHIAVLGDMAELGTLTESEHRAVGRRVAEVAELFLAVGPNMKIAADEAVASGMNRDCVEWFKDSVEAGRYLDMHVQGGDIVLIKGSQSMRMEKAVKDIMAQPLHAADILVRQESKWTKGT
jgi:UDP-N-acetylmuramyl pentapeptide synthase